MLNHLLISALKDQSSRHLFTPQKKLVIYIRKFICFVLRKAKFPIRIYANAFFGRQIRVVLPEMVSNVIWQKGYFEEDVCYYFLNLLGPGDTCIDIGGHFGFFSMLARELVGPEGTVVTFEPMPRTRAILAENMERNAGPATHYLIPAAAGAGPNKLTFKDFGLIGSAFATSDEQRSAAVTLVGKVEVDVRTVDAVVSELGLSSLKLMKIDAENAEYDVVQGSLVTLRTLRPALILEAGDASGKVGATRRVLDVVTAEGYVPYEFHRWTLRPHAITERYGYQNLLMVPQEKIAHMVGSG
jgi:FkbM family methyltransferase